MIGSGGGSRANARPFDKVFEGLDKRHHSGIMVGQE